MTAQDKPTAPGMAQVLKEEAPQAPEQAVSLERYLSSIAKSLAILASQAPAPRYQRTLSELDSFDWRYIGARVIGKHGQAVSVVEWNGQRFYRRDSAEGDKKGKAVRFSRKTGSGETDWQTLVTFKDNGATD
jgi:hypothetical protein